MLRYCTYGGIGFLHARFGKHAFSPHVHDEYSIGVICHGVLEFEWSHRSYAAEPHTISAINPGETHTGRSNAQAGWEYYNLFLPAEALRHFCPELGETLPDLNRPVIADPLTASAILAAHEAVNDEAAPALRKDGVLTMALGRLFNLHTSNKRQAASSSSRGSTARAKEYLESHFADDVRLSDLAAVAGHSPFHLVRTFANDTGLTPHAYQVQVRLNRALALLRIGRPIKEVATDVGFFDQSHFTNALKRVTGFTPSLYRKAWAANPTGPAQGKSASRP